MTYHINYAYACHAGKVRTNNEDNFWCCGESLPAENQGLKEIHTGMKMRENAPVMAVFDGMGGESQGEMAAYLASAEFGKYYNSHKKSLKKSPELFLQEACQVMNEAVCRYSRENRIASMGTTVALTVFGRKNIYICNLGDSRIYLINKEGIQQISRDHVLGTYRFGKAPLTQFLGIEEEEMKLEPAVKTVEYEAGSRFLLCSDGVTDMLAEAEIMEIMERNSSVEAAAGALLERVLEKGARDNATIILCEIEQDTHPLRSWFLQNKKENEGDRL